MGGRSKAANSIIELTCILGVPTVVLISIVRDRYRREGGEQFWMLLDLTLYLPILWVVATMLWALSRIVRNNRESRAGK